MVTQPDNELPPASASGSKAGRRRRPGRESPAVWWGGFALLVVLGVAFWSWRLLLVTLALWCMYELALVPRECRIMPNGGPPCDQPVRGRAFGCRRAHQEIKNDALWRFAGVRTNPLRRQPIADPNRRTGEVVWSPANRGELDPSDRRILLFAVLGTIVVVAGMAYGLTA